MNKIVKLTLILFLVSAIIAGILGLTNMVTEKPIAEYNERKTAEAYSAVMDFDSYDEVSYSGDRSEVTKSTRPITATGSLKPKCPALRA